MVAPVLEELTRVGADGVTGDILSVAYDHFRERHASRSEGAGAVLPPFPNRRRSNKSWAGDVSPGVGVVAQVRGRSHAG